MLRLLACHPLSRARQCRCTCLARRARSNQGVDFNAKDTNGRTPLDVATMYAKTEAIKCIENMQQLQTLPHLRQIVVDNKNGIKRQNQTSMNIHSPSSNRLSQLDVVLALENLRTLHEEELAIKKKKKVRKTIEWTPDTR